jgi:uncharacterized membrane protein YdjX (TVP38/TMEM64 family)
LSTRSDSSRGATRSPRRSRSLCRLLAAVLILAAAVVAGPRLADQLPKFLSSIESLGVWGPVVFVLGYAIGTVAFLPGSLLTLAGGALFGLWTGTLVVFLGATAGAALSFLVARYVLRNTIERRLAKWSAGRTLDRAVGENGFRIVLLLRLSPLFPFNLLNYALGLTRVRLLDYLAASIGMLPATFLYVYYGTAAGNLARIAGGASIEHRTGYWMVFTTGLFATAAVTALVTRSARRALSREVPPE